MLKKILLGAAAVIIGAIIALFAWGNAPDIPMDELKKKYANTESEFVKLDGGLTVHLRDEGPADAPAILLLHGSNASLHTWDGWTAALKGKYRIIRYDQAGHGLTGPHPKDCYTAKCFTDTIEQVAANRGLTKFTVAGNSMGGWAAYEYTKAYPNRLNGLILIDPSSAPETKKADLPIGFKIARLPGVNRLMDYITPRAIIEKSLRQTVSNQAIVTPEQIDQYWELLRRPGNRRATRLRFASRAGMMPSKPLIDAATPTLILWGKEDKLIHVGAAPWFADQFSDQQVIVYDGVGHLPMEEIAQKSADDAATWMADKSSPKSP